MASQAEYAYALLCNDDRWVAACGGSEVPFQDYQGRKVLYCWNPKQNRHAYIDCGTDIELPATYCPTDRD